MRTRETDTAWSDEFKRVLGDELRTARKMCRWTRKQLQVKLLTELGLDLSTQTIATYELGTRSISVTRLAQVCQVLGVDMREMLDRVFERLTADSQRCWIVDLVAASRIEDAALRPLRRWARVQLAAIDDDAPKTVRVSVPALGFLAELCHLDMAKLAGRLPRPRVAGAA